MDSCIEAQMVQSATDGVCTENNSVFVRGLPGYFWCNAKGFEGTIQTGMLTNPLPACVSDPPEKAEWGLGWFCGCSPVPRGESLPQPTTWGPQTTGSQHLPSATDAAVSSFRWSKSTQRHLMKLCQQHFKWSCTCLLPTMPEQFPHFNLKARPLLSKR